MRKLLLLFVPILLFAGCSSVDGRKVVTPLKIVPDGDFAELAANVSTPWTGSQAIRSAEGGLTVKDGRAVAGGYTGTVSTPLGISGGFTVRIRDVKQPVPEDETPPDEPDRELTEPPRAGVP